MTTPLPNGVIDWVVKVGVQLVIPGQYRKAAIPMTHRDTSNRKITVSLPGDLVLFAECQAARLRVSRSQVVGAALAHARAVEEERLAAEGYEFYGQDATEFANASVRCVTEAWDHAG